LYDMKKCFLLIFIPLLIIACKSPPPVEPVVIEEVIEAAEAVEIAVVIEEPEPEPEPVIEILEPQFEIVSIVILQAELINTEFETKIKIDNPNVFDVNLSSINYVLYGNGLKWADGHGKNILHIPALSSCETEFRFTMNFINTNRKLLDDVITMRNVKYRFSGNAEVEPDAAKIPSFKTHFDNSGLSEVKPNARKR